MTVTNLTPPVVTGSPNVESTLSTTPGTWDYDLDEISYTYEWLRCDAAGANCNVIGGETATTYILEAADVGSTIRSRVTATEAAGPPPGPGFDIPTYELHVKPNTWDGALTGAQYIFIYHTSPTTPTGQWGGTPIRQLQTATSWEWWMATEIKIDSSWNDANDGSQYALPLDLHNVPGDVGWSSGSGVSAVHIIYRDADLKLQHEYNSPNMFVVVDTLSKNVWHSILMQLVLGRTDGTTPQPGRTKIWVDGSLALDTGNVNNLQRFNGVNQAKMTVLDGNYSANINQESISYMTASRWGTTKAACLADSSITRRGAGATTIYDGSGSNLGPSTYSIITSRKSTDFISPP